MRRPARLVTRVRRTAVALALLLPVLAGWTVLAPSVPASAQHVAGDGRRAEIVRTLLDDRIYLEPSLAGGYSERWEQRLREVAAQVPGGVAIAGWVDVRGSTPDQDALGEDVAAAYADGGGDASIVTSSQGSSFQPTRTPGAPRAPARRAYRALDKVFDIETEAARRFSAARGLGDDDTGVEEVRVHEAGGLWILLRLLDADPPSPGALAAEVADDPTFFVDATNYSSYPDFPLGVRDDPTRRVSSLVLLAVIVAGYLLFRAWRACSRLRRRRREEQATDVRAIASPAEVEQAVTRLAEALARAPVRLDDLGYRRAQRCRDAAERYVDRDAERDRVGVLMLCRDGTVWLAGGDPDPRCFFDPGHDVSDGLTTIGGGAPGPDGVVVTALEDVDAQLPCCRRCADDVRAGAQPRALRVGATDRPDGDAVRRPYFEVEDSWTRTGYGSLSAEWAQQVLDESWGRDRRTDR